MKRVVLVLFIIVSALVVGAWLFKARVPTAGLARGPRLSINANPPTAEAYIDEIGPYALPRSQEITIGPHDVTLVAEGYKPKYVRIEAKSQKDALVISESLELVSRMSPAFLPLTTEPTASSVGADASHVYYTIGGDVREVRSMELRARLEDPILSASWTRNGLALLETQSGLYLFRPPLKITRLPVSPRKAFLLPTGESFLSQEGASVYLYDLAQSSSKNLAVLPPGATVVDAVFADTGNVGVIVYKNQEKYSLVALSLASGQQSPIKEGVPAQPNLALNSEGTVLLVSVGGAIEAYSVSPPTLVASYQKEGVGALLLVWDGTSFLLFEKTTLPDTGVAITKVSAVSPPSQNRAFLLYDAAIRSRVDFRFPPLRLSTGGVIVSENNGPLWFLGDPTKLPKSLFDRSLPAFPEEAAP